MALSRAQTDGTILEWIDQQAPRSIVPTQAVALLKQAIARQPGTVGLYYRLGVELVKQRLFDEALPALQRAEALAPEDVAVLRQLGMAYIRLRRPAEALPVFDRALTLAPSVAIVWAEKGLALEALQAPEAALHAHTRALELNPGCFTACQGITRLLHHEPHRLLAVCQKLLGRGVRHSQLLASLALALIGLGRRDALTALVDYERFLYTGCLMDPSDPGSTAAFNRELVAAIKANPTLRFEESIQATRRGWRTRFLMAGDVPVMTALVACIRRTVERYVAALPHDADHPFVRACPARASLTTWALLLRGAGYEEAHLHPDGWVSGVYYAAVPASVARASDHAGWIEFGQPPAGYYTSESLWDRPLVQPAAGTVLVFPSYFFHHTIPSGVSDERVSIAFDVIPDSALPEPL